MSAGCAMRTMNQPLACSFRCARRTLPWFIELIRASLTNIQIQIPVDDIACFNKSYFPPLPEGEGVKKAAVVAV